MNRNGHFGLYPEAMTRGIVRRRSGSQILHIGSNMKLSAARWRLTKGATLSSDRPQELLGSPATTMRALAKLQTAHLEVDMCEQALKDAHLAQLQEAVRRHHLRLRLLRPHQTHASRVPRFSQWCLAASLWRMQTGKPVIIQWACRQNRGVETLVAPGREWLQTLPAVCLLPMLLVGLLQQDLLPVGLLMMSSCHHRVQRTAQPSKERHYLASEAPLTICLQTGMLWQGSNPCHRLRSHRQM